MVWDRRDLDWEEYRELAKIATFIGFCFGLLLGVGFTLLAASQHWLVFP